MKKECKNANVYYSAGALVELGRTFQEGAIDQFVMFRRMRNMFSSPTGPITVEERELAKEELKIFLNHENSK